MDSNEKEFFQTPKLYFHNEGEIEEIVKKHLAIIVLSQIKNNSMCGQSLIIEIIEKYKIFINPSTIYPILNSLKNEGILKVYTIKGDLRTKYYAPTEEGKQIINDRLNEFIYAMEYITICIKQKVSEGIE